MHKIRLFWFRIDTTFLRDFLRLSTSKFSKSSNTAFLQRILCNSLRTNQCLKRFQVIHKLSHIRARAHQHAAPPLPALLPLPTRHRLRIGHYVCQSAQKSQNYTWLLKNIFLLKKCFQTSYCTTFNSIGDHL